MNAVAGGLVGGPGDDTLTGTASDEVIVGGLGNDLLTGGGGSDTFVYNSADEGVDTITDFVVGVGGNKLDVSDVLVGFDPDDSNPYEFMMVDVDGTDTTVSVDADGPGTSYDFAPLATLQGITVSDLGLLEDNLIF